MQQHKAYRYGLGFIATVAMIMSCSKTPKGILTEKQMQAVLADMQIAESMIGVDGKSYQDSGYKEALYKSVFQTHKITQATYDSSLVWYGENLDVYIKLLERVKNDLDNRVKALGDVQATAAPSSRQDSVDIWPRRPYLTFSPEGFFNGTTFDIRPETNYSSGSLFVLGMQVWGIRKDFKQYPVVYLAADHGDTIVMTNKTILRDGYYETRLQSIPTKRVKRVYGYIRMDNQYTNYFKVYADSISLMRYNYRSDFNVAGSDSIPAQENDSTLVQLNDSLQSN